MTDEITREMFQHSTVVIAGLNDRIEALTAENERLREALQKIADIDRYWRTVSRQSLATGDTHYDDVLSLGQFAKIASAALKEIDNG